MIIAVSNQGGVGKTTTALNVGAALAEQGFRVLLVDLDPHTGLTKSLGFDPEDFSHTSFHALTDDEIHPDLLRPLDTTGLVFVAGHKDLASLEISLRMQSERDWRRFLADFLDQVRDQFDYIVIDCPPSLGVLTINALTAADAVLAPVQVEFLALDALNTLEDQIQQIQKRTNPELTFRIVRTMQLARRKHHADGVVILDEQYPDQVLKTVVPHTIRFADSTAAGMPLIHHLPSHKGATAYRELAKEISALWPSRRNQASGIA